MTIDLSFTLGRLVTQRPGLAGALEARGLDYCCHGGRSLDQACREAGLDPAAVAAELDAAAPAADGAPGDWAALSPADLVDHLEATHHRYLWFELDRLTPLAAKVATVHGERHPELATVAELVDALRADLEPHLLKEERVLFPMVRELDRAATAPDFHCGPLANPISVILREHETVGALLAQLRAVTRGYRVRDDGCASYAALYGALVALEADTHLHIHKENNVLFPLVVARERQLAAASS